MPAHKGSKHHNSKLDEIQVAEIKKIYSDWKKTRSMKGYAELGEVYGVSAHTVRDIVIGRTHAECTNLHTAEPETADTVSPCE